MTHSMLGALQLPLWRKGRPTPSACVKRIQQLIDGQSLYEVYHGLNIPAQKAFTQDLRALLKAAPQ